MIDYTWPQFENLFLMKNTYKKDMLLLGFLLFVKVVTGFLKNDRVRAQICYLNFLH